MTIEQIKELYNEFLARKYKHISNKNYYDGNHDINFDYAMQDARSNIRCVVNYCKRFIDERVSYVTTNAVNYTSKSGNESAIELIDNNIAIWEKVHNQNLLKQSQIYGEAYELYYLDDFGEFKSIILNPLSTYVVTDLNNNVELVLREYNLKWDNDTYLEVYTSDDVTTFNVSAGFKVVGNELHRFGTVPLSICKANEESRSLIEDIKSLNDAYNNVLSDLVNEVSDFRQCFMTITGATIDNDAEALKMKSTGVIHVPEDAEISYLVKDINDSFVKNLLQELEEKMYKMVSTIDSNEKMQSNTSSVALRSRLYLLENTCGLIQGYLESAIRNRLKLFSNIQINESEQFDYKDIKIKFTANIPSDLLGLADIISKLKDIVSQKTLLTLLPFVENADLELKRFEEQRNAELNLIDKVDLNDV